MTEEAAAPAQTRGRPRPDDTVARDEKVLAHIQGAGAQTRAQIATALEMEGKQVYLSLYRLHRDGKIQRSGGSWSAAGGEVPTAPVE